MDTGAAFGDLPPDLSGDCPLQVFLFGVVAVNGGGRRLLLQEGAAAAAKSSSSLRSRTTAFVLCSTAAVSCGVRFAGQSFSPLLL
jgi:hypothetical protein